MVLTDVLNHINLCRAAAARVLRQLLDQRKLTELFRKKKHSDDKKIHAVQRKLTEDRFPPANRGGDQTQPTCCTAHGKFTRSLVFRTGVVKKNLNSLVIKRVSLKICRPALRKCSLPASIWHVE